MKGARPVYLLDGCDIGAGFEVVGCAAGVEDGVVGLGEGGRFSRGFGVCGDGIVGGHLCP